MTVKINWEGYERKEGVVAYFKVSSEHFLKVLDKNMKISTYE
jgi:hypothetical protein